MTAEHDALVGGEGEHHHRLVAQLVIVEGVLHGVHHRRSHAPQTKRGDQREHRQGAGLRSVAMHHVIFTGVECSTEGTEKPKE